MDKKGIGIYLAIIFGGGFIIEFILLYLGILDLSSKSFFHLLLLVGILCIPAAAAMLAAQLSPRDDHPLPSLWPETMEVPMRLGVVVALVFLLSNVIVGITGLSSPQWDLAVLLNQVPKLTDDAENAAVQQVAPYVVIATLPVISILLGLTLFAVVALGTEIGWRGYLLPRLLPLGRAPAYIITGALWALSLLPLIYSAFAADERLGAMPLFFLQFLIWAVFFGIGLGEIAQRTGNIGLSAMTLGCFTAQAMGLWPYLFPMAAEPWTGPFGVFALICWFILALYPRLYLGKGGELYAPLQNAPGAGAKASS